MIRTDIFQAECSNSTLQRSLRRNIINLIKFCLFGFFYIKVGIMTVIRIMTVILRIKGIHEPRYYIKVGFYYIKGRIYYIEVNIMTVIHRMLLI